MNKYFDQYTFYKNGNGQMVFDDSEGFIGMGFTAENQEEAEKTAVKEYAGYLIEDDNCHVKISGNTIWFSEDGNDDEWQHKVVIEAHPATRYVLIESNGTDEWHDWFDDLESANKEAKDRWDFMSEHDKKNQHVWVADVKYEDLEDDDDWDSFTSCGYCEGRFDSEVDNGK